MRTVRWLLTIPGAIIGWYIGVIVALLAHAIGEWLCPWQYVVSGMCFAPWSSFLEKAYLSIGSLICGSLTVLFPALIAPSHRNEVALMVYLAGLTCSGYWLLQGVWVPVLWAAFAGAMTVWRIHVVLTRHSTRMALSATF